MDYPAEEQIKTNIYEVYLFCRSASSPALKQKYSSQLCDFIFRWCRDYLFNKMKQAEDGSFSQIKEAEKMGEEILKTVLRLIRAENNEKAAKDREIFFKYLQKSLYRAKSAYYRNPENKFGIFKFPRILGDMKKLIEKQEIYTGKVFSEEEKIQCISKWFNKPEKSARIYLQMINIDNSGRLISNDKTGKNILDFMELKQPYIPDANGKSLDINVILEAAEKVLNKKQKRTRDVCRSLFALHCIDASINLKQIALILDKNIVNTYIESGEKPSQFEIYLKYHPNVTKQSAGVRAADLWNSFCNDLKKYL